jgi:hypothetical protein
MEQNYMEQNWLKSKLYFEFGYEVRPIHAHTSKVMIAKKGFGSGVFCRLINAKFCLVIFFWFTYFL